jgi:hypothetical protein
MTIEEAKEEYSSSVTGDAYVAEVYGEIGRASCRERVSTRV